MYTVQLIAKVIIEMGPQLRLISSLKTTRKYVRERPLSVPWYAGLSLAHARIQRRTGDPDLSRKITKVKCF